MADFKKIDPTLPPTAERGPRYGYKATESKETEIAPSGMFIRRKRNGGVKHTLEETPAVADELIQYIRDGMFIREAAAMIGVRYQTVYTWLRQGRKDIDDELDTVFAHLYVGVQMALAEAKHDSVTAIRRAGQNPQFWMAHAWYLERRYPQEFGKQDRLQLQHGGTIGTASVGISAVLKDSESRKALADVVGILASGGLSVDESTSTGDGDDEWEDTDTTALGLIESEFA